MQVTSSTPQGQQLRVGRRSIPGQIYMVTTVTRHRSPLFNDIRPARTTIACLRRMDELAITQTLCFVLMPDHLHWLFTLRDRLSLSSAVGRLKSYSARRLGRPVWQPGFHDHAVRREEDVRTMARYIIANPLRAGLVERIEDYPHWDACWL